VEVCPRDIPLTSAIAAVGQQTTIERLRDIFIK